MKTRWIGDRVMPIVGLGITLFALTPASQAEENGVENESAAYYVLDMLQDAGAGEGAGEGVEPSFRHALIQAREAKFNFLGIAEVIVAEDIADFPDLNLADSIQRMPGATIAREGGEGRRVALRGIGGNFTKVYINGMQAQAFSSSPMDSRGSNEYSRTFDFNIFASELFDSITIAKSYSAEMSEGGIGGTIYLETPKPFDNPGFHSKVSAQLGNNNDYLPAHLSPRLAFVASNTWGETFGILSTVSYSFRNIVETGYNTFRWRTRTPTDINPLIDSGVRSQLESGEVYFSRGNRLSVWENEQERIGMTTTFEYKPSIDLSITGNILHSSFLNDKVERHLATNGSSATGLGRIEDIRLIERDDHLEAAYVAFSNSPLKTEYRKDVADAQFTQLTLEGVLDVSDRTTLTALIGSSRTTYDIPLSDKAYLETIDNYGLITDYTVDRYYGRNTYVEDLLDLTRWQVNELDLQEFERTSESKSLQTGLTYRIDDSKSVNAGVSWQSMSSRFLAKLDKDYLSKQATPLNGGDRDIGGRYSVFRDHEDADWLVADLEALQEFYGIDADLGMEDVRTSRDRFYRETTVAPYIKYAWNYEKIKADFGARYYNTKIKVRGLVQDSGLYEASEDTQEGLLPSLNVSYEITSSRIARLNLAQNITRPDFGFYHDVESGEIDTANNSVVAIHSASIDPYRSDEINLSLESYFDEVGYVAAGLFYKKISNFPVATTSLVPYGTTGYADTFLQPGQTSETLMSYTRYMGTDSTEIIGMELSFQRDFDFLPAPFHHLGFISNITFVDGQAIYSNVQGSGLSQAKDFPGLSSKSSNLTLYYSPNTWSMRLSFAYRDRYISKVESGLGDEDERGFHSTVNVDFSADYSPFENVTFNVEGINLMNEREEQYSDSADRLYNTSTSGRMLYLGLSYSF